MIMFRFQQDRVHVNASNMFHKRHTVHKNTFALQTQANTVTDKNPTIKK